MRRADDSSLCFVDRDVAAIGLRRSFAEDGCAKLEYGTENNIAYYDAAALARADQYQKEQTKLDVYYPKVRRASPPSCGFMVAA